MIVCPDCESDFIEDDGDVFVCFDCLAFGESDELLEVEA